MKNSAKTIRGACLVLLLAAAAGCTTVNKFDSYRVEGATVSVSMRKPPEPTLDVSYNITLDPRDQLRTALSVGTTILKAYEASEIEPLMIRALSVVDVPGIIETEAYSACLAALDARSDDRRFEADYLLDLDIRKYGIDADSPWGAVSLSVRLTARLFHNGSGELVWRRDFSVRKQASPDMFGFGEIAGNIVSAAALANLSDQDLAKGFEQLADFTARSFARTLEDDLYEARFEDE
jgi:ABC-type uncharacterized transport system auxiliary subunit